MEEQLITILDQTQSTSEAPRKQAELQLQQLHANPAYPLSLTSIASHTSVPTSTRQAALLSLKTFVLASWSPALDEFKGQVLVSDDDKRKLREGLLGLATSGEDERRIKSAASYVVSKIAAADFPDEWPDLIPTLLHIIRTGSEGQMHGALKVLGDLVEDAFSDEQFFASARDIVKTVFDVAVDGGKKAILRALAVNTFRGCFDMLEMVLESHKGEVKRFADETLKAWMPFFLEMLKTRLPDAPSEEDESYRGLLALKLQVVKVLMRIRSVFPAILSPQSPVLFSATWDELSALEPAYHAMYILDERQGRLEDADGLPYTLDFLVLEELDFMQACIRAPPVKKELEQQLQSQTSSGGNSWIYEVMRLATSYAQIITEEEGLWDIDVNVFLSEETSATANYTPRTACGDLVIKLGEWIIGPTVDGLLAFTRTLYSSDQSWKAKEAALYVLNQLLADLQDVDKTISPEAANGFVDFVRYAMQQPDVFLRARGYLVAGSLIRTSGDALHPVAGQFLEATLNAINHDESDVIKVSCIRALQHYLSSLPPLIATPFQGPIISALSNWLMSQDLNELKDSEDLQTTFLETLRDVIILDTRIVLTGAGLDVLLTIGSHCASNFQLVMMANETFEEIASTISAMGGDAYVQLCAKVLPSITGAFDVASLTEENSLTNFAADLLSTLAEYGPEPLPEGFIATVMPKLNRLLFGSTDEELLKPATTAVKWMLTHDPEQLFKWQDETGKGGLEVVLVIIDRLLNPSVEDHAAQEVGGLAAEVVEKAGAERLGPYLMQLLRAVAVRLETATQAQFIQSLILVFARLSLASAHEVVDFLAQVQVGSQSGLQVVMSKWLENSINFTGYDEIRQNVIALSNLYNLQDPRLAQIQVKGDLIVPTSDRIMTRSRARQNPDQYTMVPASLKIVKVLVEELLSASGAQRNLDVQAAADLAEEGSDDDDWEDETNVLDLGLPATKQELMAWGDGSGNFGDRQRDDETQEYLIGFFREQSQKAEFREVFAALTPEEQEKLRSMS